MISAMLAMLADPATQARFAVQNALLRMGGIIAGPLAAFLDTHSGKAAEAGLRVAESLAEPSFLPAAQRLSRTPDDPESGAPPRTSLAPSATPPPPSV